MARLLPGHRLDPKLQHQRFEVADPRYAFFDNVDFAGKELINHVNDRLGVLLADPLRIAALPFLPTCALRRPAIADLVWSLVEHADLPPVRRPSRSHMDDLAPKADRSR